MKYQLVAPPSKTEQSLSFEIPDLPTSISPVISGTTPIDPAPPVNQLPVVSVSPVTIKLPATIATLSAIANDPDGVIGSYVWEILNGLGKLVEFDKPTIHVSDLTSAGITNIRVTVYDDKGASASAFTTIVVQEADVVNPPGNYGTLLYSTGYNTLSDIINSSNQQGNGGLSTTIFKDGPGSFKSVPANVSAGIRSEVQYSSSLTPTKGAIEYDVLYETIFPDSGHSLQFHPNTSGGSASPGFWHENSKLVIVNWKGGTNTKYSTGFTIPQNKWLHVVFEYAMGSAGFMRLTIDGKVYLDVKNIQVGDGSGAYLKVGVNMWKNQKSVVYYDNLKIWKS